MDRLISCEFNMDNACVELKFLDGSMIAIDTIAVENEVADNMYQRSELDYLIYNDPLGLRDSQTLKCLFDVFRHILPGCLHFGMWTDIGGNVIHVQSLN